jgi:hypothetical protein
MNYIIDCKQTTPSYFVAVKFMNLTAQNDGYTSALMQNGNTNTDHQGGKCNLISLYQICLT